MLYIVHYILLIILGVCRICCDFEMDFIEMPCNCNLTQYLPIIIQKIGIKFLQCVSVCLLNCGGCQKQEGCCLLSVCSAQFAKVIFAAICFSAASIYSAKLLEHQIVLITEWLIWIKNYTTLSKCIFVTVTSRVSTFQWGSIPFKAGLAIKTGLLLRQVSLLGGSPFLGRSSFLGWSHFQNWSPFEAGPFSCRSSSSVYQRLIQYLYTVCAPS